jgi:hypothetical protein
MIQINAAAETSCSVQLVSVGTNPAIAAVYVDGVSVVTPTYTPGNFGTSSTMGTVITVEWSDTYPLEVGHVVKVVCADGGAASLTRTT